MIVAIASLWTVDGDRHGNHGRGAADLSRDSDAAIGYERAARARRRPDFRRDLLAREDGVDRGRSQRKLHAAEGVEGMPEGENAVPLAVCGGADRGRAHVPAHELDADGGARHDRVTGSSVRRAPTGSRDKPVLLEPRIQVAERLGRETREREGGRDGSGFPLRRRGLPWGQIEGSVSCVGGLGPLFRRGAERGEHLSDRRDAGDRILGEGPRVGNGADELPAYVHRAPAHSRDDPGPLEEIAARLREDEVGPGTVSLKHAENRHRKAVDLGPPKHAQAVSGHAGTDRIGGKRGGLPFREWSRRDIRISGADGEQEKSNPCPWADPGSRPETEAPRS